MSECAQACRRARRAAPAAPPGTSRLASAGADAPPFQRTRLDARRPRPRLIILDWFPSSSGWGLAHFSMIFNGDALNDFVFLGWFGGSQGLDAGKLDLADDIRRLKAWLRTKPGVRQRGTYPLHDPPPASFRVKPGQKGPDRQVRARFAVAQRIRDGQRGVPQVSEAADSSFKHSRMSG